MLFRLVILLASDVDQSKKHPDPLGRGLANSYVRLMPRRRRFATGGYVFHVLNRAIGRRAIFERDSDYDAFERVLDEAQREVSMRILGYALMPNHWHLVLWPKGDSDLSAFMQWLTLTHTQRYHKAKGTIGTGPIYQGRFKSFPIEADDHFLRVCRYVERNPLRAGLVSHAENWRWTSLWQWCNQHCDVSLTAWPVPRPTDWIEYVNSVENEAELVALRNSVIRGAPFGDATWRRETAWRLGLEESLRLPGRPRV
jgi:putative transposase